MYLQRTASATLKSLVRANTSSLGSRIITNYMLSSSIPPFPQRPPPPSLSDKEIAKRKNKKSKMKERIGGSGYVLGSGRADSYQGGGGGGGGGGAGLPPRPKSPEAWGNGYRADSRAGRHGDVGREGQGWRERPGTLGRRNENVGHRNENVGHRNAGHRNSETTRSLQGSPYGRANTSDHGGVTLHNQFDGNTSRSGQYGNQYRNPPLPGYGGAHASSSYSSAPGTHQHYEAPGRRSWGLPQHPADGSHRSSHRGPPTARLQPRGPLSSSQLSQRINKRSRYASPGPDSALTSIAAFSTATAEAAAGTTVETTSHTERRARKAAHRAAKKAANDGAVSEVSRRNTVPTTNRTAPPPPPLSPPPFHTNSPPLLPFRKSPLPVPTPLQSYLSLSLIQSPRLASPARQLIILDLNGTLLSREGRRASASLNPTPRPGLGLFLRYLFAQFNVMVWSSAQPDNVRMMVNALFSAPQKAALLALWGRDTLGLTKYQFGSKIQVYKRLERVWDGQYRVPHSEQGRAWDQTNTMLLDDSAAKAKGQPWNHLEVPEFLGRAGEMKQDRALYALVGYLEELKWSGNVSAFIRGMPFKLGEEWDATGTKVLSEYDVVGWDDRKNIAAGEQRL